MADRPPPGQVTCPLSDQVCTTPDEGSDSLPKQFCLPYSLPALHVLHIIELNEKITTLETTVVERDITITEQDNTISTLSHVLKNGQ